MSLRTKAGRDLYGEANPRDSNSRVIEVLCNLFWTDRKLALR